MKNVILIYIVLLFCFASCNNQQKSNALHEKECLPFKNGTFFNEKKDYKIVRQGNSQKEYDLKNKSEYHFEVHWLYGCAYNLIFKYSINPIDEFDLEEKDMLRVQIVEIKDQTIVSEIDFKGNRYHQTFQAR